MHLRAWWAQLPPSDSPQAFDLRLCQVALRESHRQSSKLGGAHLADDMRKGGKS